MVLNNLNETLLGRTMVTTGRTQQLRRRTPPLATAAAEPRVISTCLNDAAVQDDGHDWEDAAFAPANAAAGDVEFQFQRDGAGGAGGATDEGSPPQKKRATITKVDRQYAAMLHQAHLLFLLGRGLLFDRAADDPMLQVPHIRPQNTLPFRLLHASLSCSSCTCWAAGCCSTNRHMTPCCRCNTCPAFPASLFQTCQTISQALLRWLFLLGRGLLFDQAADASVLWVCLRCSLRHAMLWMALQVRGKVRKTTLAQHLARASCPRNGSSGRSNGSAARAIRIWVLKLWLVLCPRRWCCRWRGRRRCRPTRRHPTAC